jgi:hypothetical protein
VDERPALKAAAAAAIALGFALRLAEAARFPLNPDEALHLFVASPADWLEQFRTVHHPPLLFLVLRAALAVSASEIALRFVPALAGALYPWFAYRWLARAVNPGAGLAALLLLEFSPNLVALSPQARGYSLALMFAAAAMLCLERALQSESPRWIALFTACLYGAVLAEYSAAFFAAAAGIYALARRPSRRFLFPWAAGQAGAIAIYAILYRVQIAPLLADRARLVNAYLRGAFPQPGENPLGFAARGIIKQFAYTMSSIPLGVAAAALFAIGIALLWSTGRRALVWGSLAALLLPLAAALAGVFPYGRSRHTVIVSLFLAAGIGAALDRLLRGRARMAAVALVALWPLAAEPDQNNPPRDHTRGRLVAAIERLRSIAGAGPVLADYETALVLRYYLEGARGIEIAPHADALREARIGGVRMTWRYWDHGSPAVFRETMALARRELRVAPDAPLWVVDGGFDSGLAARLHTGAYPDLDGLLAVFAVP